MKAPGRCFLSLYTYGPGVKIKKKDAAKHPSSIERNALARISACAYLKLNAGNFPGFQNASAYVHALRLSVHQNPDFLHVDTPGTLVSIVSVGHMVSCARSFAGNKAFTGHE